MKTLAELGAANAAWEGNRAAREFTDMVRWLGITKNKTDAAMFARSNGAAPRTISALMQKADAGSTISGSGSTWGEELSALSQAFISGLGTAGAFDRAIGSMRLVPMQVRVSLITGVAIGEEVQQGRLKRIGELQCGNASLTQSTVATTIVCSAELARLSGPSGLALMQSELKNATSTATDQVFASTLSSGLTPIPSVNDPLSDLLAAAEAITPTGDTSTLIAIVSSLTCKRLALRATPSGEVMFPGMSATRGGSIAGIQILPSLAMGNQILVFDGQAVAANPGRALPAGSKEALVHMDVDDEESIVIDLYGSNSVALRVERVFAASLIYQTGAALIDNVSYGSGS